MHDVKIVLVEFFHVVILLIALLRCEFWTVFTRLGSAVRVAMLYDFSDGYYKQTIGSSE
jgi:hypothetical protein